MRQEWDSQLNGLVLTGAINGYALFDRHTGQLLSCLANSGELIAEVGSGDEQPSLLAQELLHVFNTSEAKWQSAEMLHRLARCIVALLLRRGPPANRVLPTTS